VDQAWKCDVCGQIYSDLEMAEQCEADHGGLSSFSIKKVVYDKGAHVPRYLVVSNEDEDVPDVTYVFSHVGDVDV
jgi:hypothetical protein